MHVPDMSVRCLNSAAQPLSFVLNLCLAVEFSCLITVLVMFCVTTSSGASENRHLLGLEYISPFFNR